MPESTIPETDNVQVAVIAAAMRMAEACQENGSSKTLDDMISRFDKSYTAVVKTLNTNPISRPAKAN